MQLNTTRRIAVTRPLGEPPPIPRRRCAIANDILPTGARLGDWRIDSELGRGGMASVYAATHATSGAQAAIKVAHASILSAEYTPAMFLREARVVRLVAHPAVIQMSSTGTHGDRPYLVMEKFSGKTLGQLMAAGPIPRAEALDVLLELCDVLRAAHEAGVVHRDLKLDNVMVVDAPYDGDRRVKLLDWGVAYVAHERDPFRGLIAGTLTYVAPEQILGKPLTGASDVYSLAVVAFQLLCGRPPFAAASDLKLCAMHLGAEAPRARTAWADVPEALDSLLYAMLAKRPDQRPSLDEVERVIAAARDAIAPPIDDSCRPLALPTPPFRAGWISLAILVAAFASLLSALA